MDPTGIHYFPKFDSIPLPNHVTHQNPHGKVPARPSSVGGLTKNVRTITSREPISNQMGAKPQTSNLLRALFSRHFLSDQAWNAPFIFWKSLKLLLFSSRMLVCPRLTFLLADNGEASPLIYCFFEHYSLPSPYALASLPARWVLQGRLFGPEPCSRPPARNPPRRGRRPPRLEQPRAGARLVRFRIASEIVHGPPLLMPLTWHARSGGDLTGA